MTRLHVAFAVTLLVACNQIPVDEEFPETGTWELVWGDEFNGALGSPPDPGKWVHNIGGHGWGNQSLEYDTDRVENAQLDGDGNLVITARQEAYEDNWYTSARLVTEGKFARTYGRFEARLKLPTGRGLWPAFWLLGSNYREVGWPASGEMDVMEHRGSTPSLIWGSAHGPGYSAGNALSEAYSLPDGGRFPDEFHTFAIEWEPGRVRWFVDGQLYHTITEGTMAPGDPWVFDAPMFIIVNLAVGGLFDGDPDATTHFPQSLHVDYVRVYEQRELE